jgi:MerR family transcriptional regulator/heat shock protein HspR
MARRERRMDISDRAIYVISVAAELAGVHPQTLRVYERKGLLTPARTAGNTRRYSDEDISRLRRIQELTQEGVNLAGVERIMELETQLAEVQRDLELAMAELDRMEQRFTELMSARDSSSMVLLKDIRRIRRAMKSDALDAAARSRIFTAPPISEG